MLVQQQDLYPVYSAQPSFGAKVKRFITQRGIELTIAIVGLVIGMATVIVTQRVGSHQEILQASRMTDNYFNGILELFTRAPDEDQRLNQLMIARTEAIIEDLHTLHKPDKIASVITFISNLKPKLFHEDRTSHQVREKYIYLGDINLAGTNLRNLNLAQASLPSSDLTGCDLSHTILRGAKLKKAIFKKATLDFVDFSGAQLQGADFQKASLYRVNFTDANLEGVIWVDGKVCQPGSIGVCKE